MQITDAAPDIRVTELLCARLCHELVGPVGAVGNGLELLVEDPGDRQVVNMLVEAGAIAGRRLAFYRVAYGTAGGLPVSGRLDETRKLANGLITDGKVTADWSGSATVSDLDLGLAGVKLLLNVFVIALEALPRGGLIRVAMINSGGKLGIRLAASGPGARLFPEQESALGGNLDVEQLTPRNIHVHYTASHGATAGSAKLRLEKSADSIVLSTELPTGA